MNAMRLHAANSRPQGSVRRLILFLAAGEPNSLEAQDNLTRFCESDPALHCDLQIVNVFEDFQTALDHGVLVTPCLVMVEPPPRVIIAGNLRDIDKVRAALRLTAE